MKKIFTFFLAAAVVLSSFTAVGAADSAAAYGFIESNGKTAKGNVTFNVSKGKTAESLMLNGEEVKEGDGTTPWESGFSSAEKNWVYDSANGTLTLSQRYIVTDIDLFGAGSLSFTLNFTDGTSDNITLKGVYNYVPAPKSFKDYSESAKEGYLNTELKPDSSWRITASSAKSSPDRYLDGDATESHSYYEHNGAFVLRYSAPHYVVIDTGKTTEVSGVRYVPRTTNSVGSWAEATYLGSNDGETFSPIGEYKYPGAKEESITDFGKNVTYRYYMVKINSATGGYAAGYELHLTKPAASRESVKVDLSSGGDAVWNTGSYGKSISAVYIDNAAVSDGFSLSDGKFTLSNELLKNIGEGSHTLKAVFSDSYMEVGLVITDDGAAIASVKADAVSELSVFGDGAENYKAEIMKKTSADEVYAYLDEAENALGAQIKTLCYNEKMSLDSPSVLNQSVNPDGKKAGDSSSVSAGGSFIKAVGLGRAAVSSGGKIYIIKTVPSKIALVLISGQSNAAGDDSDYRLAPSATGKYEDRYFITNSVNLSRPLSDVTKEDAVYTARNGGRPDISDDVWSKNGVLHSAAAASGLGARLSDEWNMPVWVVNTAVCARTMQGFDPTLSGSTAYTGAVNYLNKVRGLIESDAHFSLDGSKTGMFWLQGESNGIGDYCTTSTMEEYRSMFMNMFNSLKNEVGINYCGIWLVRARVTNSNSDSDFEFSGPRLAQVYLSNSGKEEYKNIYLLLNTDLWRDGVSEYFDLRHPDAAAFREYYGYDRPSSLSEVKPGLHHSQKGYNELGDEAGEVIAKILSGNAEAVTDGYIATYDGREAAGFNLGAGKSAYAVPMAKTPYYNASAGLTVKIADEKVAVYDPETFMITGVSGGTTEAGLYCNGTLLKSYSVSVTGNVIEDSVLSDRTKWTLEASSRWNEGRDVKYLTDFDTSTSWTADINQKLPANEQWIQITLPEKTYVSGFSFNTYSDASGFPTEYVIYVDTGTGEFTEAAKGTYLRSDYVTAKKYDISFEKNYPAKRVKFLFKNGHNGYAAMSEVYLTAKNTALSDYKEKAEISVSKVESGVYKGGTGIIRFITTIGKLPANAKVEYFGSYAVKSSVFDKDNKDSALVKTASPESGKSVSAGDTWALDIKNIGSENFNVPVTAISFIKLEGDGEVYYSESVVSNGVDESVKIEK